jgi:hypothetical protein
VRDVALTILTGRRPALLARTLAAMPVELLAAAHVVVLHNGGDEETSRVLEAYLPAVDRLHVHPGELLPIGEAASLLAMLALDSGKPLTLRLEDDWVASGDGVEWLAWARAILFEDLDVFEVRLRLASMACWSKHAITGAPIVWRDHGHYRTAEGHLSIAPTLCRTADLAQIFPCDGEKDAMRQAHAAGLRRIAQLVPGVFEHIGDGQSLRKQTGCAA